VGRTHATLWHGLASPVGVKPPWRHEITPGGEGAERGRAYAPNPAMARRSDRTAGCSEVRAGSTAVRAGEWPAVGNPGPARRAPALSGGLLRLGGRPVVADRSRRHAGESGGRIRAGGKSQRDPDLHRAMGHRSGPRPFFHVIGTASCSGIVDRDSIAARRRRPLGRPSRAGAPGRGSASEPAWSAADPTSIPLHDLLAQRYGGELTPRDCEAGRLAITGVSSRDTAPAHSSSPRTRCRPISATCTARRRPPTVPTFCVNSSSRTPVLSGAGRGRRAQPPLVAARGPCPAGSYPPRCRRIASRIPSAR